MDGSIAVDVIDAPDDYWSDFPGIKGRTSGWRNGPLHRRPEFIARQKSCARDRDCLPRKNGFSRLQMGGLRPVSSADGPLPILDVIFLPIPKIKNLSDDERVLSWQMTGILQFKLEPSFRASYAEIQSGNDTKVRYIDPWPLFSLHFGDLTLRDLARVIGVTTGYEDCNKTYNSSEDKGINFRPLPAYLSLILGSFFIGIGLYPAYYGVKRGLHPTYSSVLCCFLCLLVGIPLVFFVLLPYPPPVMGFSVQHICYP